LKYRPGFPDRFGSIQDARVHCRDFFTWYNEHHHHSGIAMLTPQDVHNGLAAQRLKGRENVLLGAFQAHPERFVSGPPKPIQPPTQVWINKPKEQTEKQTTLN